jgi:hypothetical protein
VSFERLADAWRNAEPRRRMVIGIPAAALIVVATYVGVIEPLQSASRKMRANLPALEARRDGIRAQAHELRSQAARPAKPALDNAVIQAALARHRLAELQPVVETKGDNRTRLHLPRAPFFSIWPAVSDIADRSWHPHRVVAGRQARRGECAGRSDARGRRSLIQGCDAQMARLIAFLLLLSSMLVAQAPAWLVADRLAADRNGWIELRNPAGTLWSGSAEAYVPAAGGTANALALGRLTWRIARLDWSRRTLVFDISQTPGAPRPAELIAGFDRRAVSGAVRLPAAVAMRLPQLAGWTIGGTVTFDSDSFEWNGSAAGNLNVLWQNASITPIDLPEAIALGDVSGRIVADAKGISLSFANAGGSIQLNGSSDSRTGQVSVQAQPRSSATPAQIAWLQSHLRPQPQGGYAIGFTLPRQ